MVEKDEIRNPTEEVDVRKAVAVELVSVDGVMESPEEWAFSYSNDEMEEANAAGMAASDVLGRVACEGLAAFWPPEQPGGDPMVDYTNSVSKVVVSTTLEEPLEWNNSALIGDDVAEEIADLKRQGHHDRRQRRPRQVAAARRAPRRTVTLMVHPIVLGVGKRLFEDGDLESLELVGSQTFGSGVSPSPTGRRKRRDREPWT